MMKYDNDSILLHAGSMNFSGKQFSLHPGTYKLSLRLELPVRKGKYSVELGLFSAGKWIDTWNTSTKLIVLDTFEGYSGDASMGILNIKTNFNLEAISEPTFSRNLFNG
jgi:hypothetical protein